MEVTPDNRSPVVWHADVGKLVDGCTTDDAPTGTYTLAQEAQLEQLHAAFRRAASVHNIMTGDSSKEIEVGVSVRFCRFGQRMLYCI